MPVSVQPPAPRGFHSRRPAVAAAAGRGVRSRPPGIVGTPGRLYSTAIAIELLDLRLRETPVGHIVVPAPDERSRDSAGETLFSVRLLGALTSLHRRGSCTIPSKEDHS